MLFEPTDLEKTGLDTFKLNKELQQTKARAFLGKRAAFMGPLMCTLEFVWSEELSTAATDGITLWWNPHFFNWCTPKTREFVLMHELTHVGHLHCLRLGTKDPDIWNQAADYMINNGLHNDGYDLSQLLPPNLDPGILLDHQYDGLSSEEIYDRLMKNPPPPPPANGGGIWGKGSGLPGDSRDIYANQSPEDQRKMVQNVVKAIQTAKAAKEPGAIPGGVEEIVDEFLSPKLNWKQILHRFFQDMCKTDFSWKRPNRRYADIYMPSMDNTEGRLQKLFYYLDVSGSVTHEQVIRFNSELAYVKKKFNPVELRLITFDVRITKEYVFKEEDEFEKLVIIGRGGTSFRCVREHILEHKPTAAIIFSDMYVDPMEPVNCPVIWICIDHKKAKVPFGTLIHLEE